MRGALLVALALACVCAGSRQGFVHEPTASYKALRMQGFTVRISKAARAHPDETRPALKLLDEQLREIARIVPAKALEVLRTMPFWIEQQNPDFPCACYHEDAGWLKEHGYNPDKRRSVEICNTKNFVGWIKLNQPYMVLHELSHGYHDIMFGFEDPYIKACYKKAVLRGDYEKVAHNLGGTRKHYALTNQQEYFAEATEAYFGRNDFFPYTREDLRKFDPVAFAMIERCWRVSTQQAVRSLQSCFCNGISGIGGISGDSEGPWP